MMNRLHALSMIFPLIGAMACSDGGSAPAEHHPVAAGSGGAPAVLEQGAGGGPSTGSSVGHHAGGALVQVPAYSTGGEGTGGLEPGTDSSGGEIAALRTWLLVEPSARAALESEAFSTVPLSLSDAGAAHELLWSDRASQIRKARQTEVYQKSISIGSATLDYETVLLGDEPEGGRSLIISMHGGGNAPKATNDEQWQNQIALAQSYKPQDSLWVAPRAPIDDWNMWFTSDIPPLFDRLITNLIVFAGINPDKVYLTGYSAGGDGVYQLGPTMADRWAGAAMSAGHPNDMTPTNLRNLPFAIHVGGDDTAYDRNLVAAEWGLQLDQLRAVDSEGYPHQVQVHEGLPHWMNLADQPSIPFIQSYTRDIYVERIVWRQSTLLETRFYWMKIDPEQALKNSEVTASIDGQMITVNSDDLSSLQLLLSDKLLDLDQEVSVSWNDSVVFSGVVPRTILAIERSLADREDPAASFSAEILVTP